MVRLPLQNSRDWIGRTPIRKTSSVRGLFLLPGGEGQDEGESSFSKNEMRPTALHRCIALPHFASEDVGGPP
jgi:hypothetical protein